MILATKFLLLGHILVKMDTVLMLLTGTVPVKLTLCLFFFFVCLVCSLSSVSEISCAGAIGTCTHGSGKNFGILAMSVSFSHTQH